VPARFDLTFVNNHGEDETPLCIHRAPLGTHERLIGFLLEHYAGAFPVWLAPEQVRVIPITDDQNDYAQQLADQLELMGVRASADLGSDRMNAKIREAQVLKVPYMLVVGEREKAENTISLRKRNGDKVNDMAFDAFVVLVKERIGAPPLHLTAP
jgi:threonyl-tRNA synthetase